MPKAKLAAPASGRILVAIESFSREFEGSTHQFNVGATTVEEGHPITEGVEHLFAPLRVHYWIARRPEVEQATAAPGEVRGG